MRAAVYRAYGPPSVVRVEEIETPTPKANEVLIKIRASTVSSADWRARTLQVPAGFGPFARPIFGFFGPRKTILGCELSGEIAAVGSEVHKFKIGDAVFAYPGFALGSHAEYRVMPESGRLALLPKGVTFEEGAALCFGGTTALHYLRDLAKLQPGERALILGASGAVGSAAVQLAKHFGAHVTGVCSTRNVECVRALGADDVIDYTQESFADPKRPAKYDVIFDTIGVTTYAACKGSLSERGRLLLCAADLKQLLSASFSSKRVIAGNTPERLEDMLALRELAEAGHYRPLIDRSYPLSAIAEAHTLVESGHKRGSVVITMTA